MRDLSVDFLAHLQQNTTTLAEAWQVTRADGEVFGWTAHDLNVTIDGVVYHASQGLTATAAHTSDDLRVDTLDVTVFLDLSTEEEVLAGLWDNSAVTHFWYNWADPPADLTSGDALVVRHGTLGEVTLAEGVLQAQVRGLLQRLTVRIGRQYSPGCPWRHATWNGSTYVASLECGVTLTSFIHVGAVTEISAAPDREFSDATSAQAAGYYNEGFLTMTSGVNAGLTREIALWSNQLFTLKRPFPYAVAAGDTYKAVRGDEKTALTCKDIFDNLDNFGGFPHLPGIDAVYSNPTGL